MATIPTVANIDESRIPVEGSVTFRSDASYVWSALPNTIKSLNTATGVMNTEIQKVNENTLQVSLNTQLTTEAKQSAQNARDEAVLAKDEIKGYVVPTEATYSPTRLDENFANIGNNILRIQQDLTGLQLNIKVV